MSTTTEQRFWSKVNKTDQCWTWTASHTNGYGRFDAQGHRLRAHRYAYELENGPIADGLQLDHLCRNRLCVRPSHLEAVTQHVNIMRSEAPSALNARLTTCLRGHSLTDSNVYTTPAGRRQCRTCQRARNERQTARRKARGRVPQVAA